MENIKFEVEINKYQQRIKDINDGLFNKEILKKDRIISLLNKEIEALKLKIVERDKILSNNHNYIDLNKKVLFSRQNELLTEILTYKNDLKILNDLFNIDLIKFEGKVINVKLEKYLRENSINVRLDVTQFTHKRALFIYTSRVLVIELDDISEDNRLIVSKLKDIIKENITRIENNLNAVKSNFDNYYTIEDNKFIAVNKIKDILKEYNFNYFDLEEVLKEVKRD